MPAHPRYRDSPPRPPARGEVGTGRVHGARFVAGDSRAVRGLRGQTRQGKAYQEAAPLIFQANSIKPIGVRIGRNKKWQISKEPKPIRISRMRSQARARPIAAISI